MIPTQFIEFLHSELAIPTESITFALRQAQPTPDQFSIILLQYGLISLEQLECIFDWLETTT